MAADFAKVTAPHDEFRQEIQGWGRDRVSIRVRIRVRVKLRVGTRCIACMIKRYVERNVLYYMHNAVHIISAFV